MEIQNDVFNSLYKYFNSLTYTGYNKISNVYKLLIYTFIEQLLNDPKFNLFISEKDYKSISQALNCLYGSNCLIPYPLFITIIDSSKPIEEEDDYILIPRITELGDYRFTEDDNLRFINE